MILRKPYAFLIKNFKKIHIALAVLMAYIIYKTYTIYRFFRNSAANNYYASIAYEDRHHYVNIFVLFIIILIIAALIAIYYLLNHKKKPRKFYRYSIIFFVAIFIFYVVLSNVFRGLVETSIETQAIRALSDISIISLIPQLALFAYSLFIAFGSNLKKFNFAEDLKELEITEADREEIEVNIKFDGYKTRRSARRQLREFKYYVKENSFIISCILIVVGAVIGINIISKVITRLTSRNGVVSVSNKFSIKVEDSIISNLTTYGEEINGKYYVVVRLYMKNTTKTNVSLDYTNYHLIYRKKNITPKLAASDYFHDFAKPYLGDGVGPQEEKTIALAYEIDKKDINASFLLKIYKGSTETAKSLKSNYNEIRLRPKKMVDVGDAARVQVNEELSFANSTIGNAKVKVNNVEMVTSYKYNYSDCSTGSCINKNDIITPDYTKSNKSPCLVVMDYEYNPDEKTIYGKSKHDFDDFMDDFLRVKYVIAGQTYYSKAIAKTPDNLEKKAVFQVDKNIMNADQVQLVFTVRNRNHIVIVK